MSVFCAEDAAYAATCSGVTVCSSARGFFRPLAAEAAERAPRCLAALTAAAAAGDASRLAAARDDPELMCYLGEVWTRIESLRRGKDARAAAARRTAAQAALNSGDVRQALALASQAVLRAPPTGEDDAIEEGVTLALCLWVRAGALLRGGHAAAALVDLQRALRERLPARMRAQYYWRMGHCYKESNEPTRAKVSYELAMRLLDKDDAAKSQLSKDIESLDYSVEQNKPSKESKAKISLTGGAKLNMPALSKLVKITEEQNKGRFAVANSPIKPGDVLLIDEPYAACLLPDNYSTHCLHCFKRLDDFSKEAPIGCPKCSAVAFCSTQCRNAAVPTYHQYECPFLDLFIGSGMSILSFIALRMVTQAGLDTSLSIYDKYILNTSKSVECSVVNDIEGSKRTKMKSRKERLNRTKKGLKNFAENNLKEDEIEQEETVNLEEKLELRSAQIYALCVHSDKRKGEDFLLRIVMAMFLTECLKRTEFFKSCDKENFEKAENSVCELILRNLQLLQFNAHEIYETVRGAHMFSRSRPKYIAVGIYPTGALFNHECCPAVARYFEGNKIVLRAIRPLSVGDVVSENYGPHFLMQPLKERQRSLSCRYWFRCECVACREDWPTSKQMNSNDFPYLRCPNLACTGKFKGNLRCLPSKCTKCSTHIDKDLVKINVQSVDNCVARYQEAARLMDAEDAVGATDALCDALETFYSVARPPHIDTHLAQESLRCCFAVFGNTHTVHEKDLVSQTKDGTKVES